MSVELSIRVTKPIPPEDVVEGIERALQELLNLSARPKVRARGTEAEWTITIPDVAEVAVLILDLAYGESLRETAATAVVSAGGFRSAGSFALMIAVAITLARRSGGKILDESRLVGASRKNDPEAVLARLRLRDEHGDLLNAAERLYRGRGA